MKVEGHVCKGLSLHLEETWPSPFFSLISLPRQVCANIFSLTPWPLGSTTRKNQSRTLKISCNKVFRLEKQFPRRKNNPLLKFSAGKINSGTFLAKSIPKNSHFFRKIPVLRAISAFETAKRQKTGKKIMKTTFFPSKAPIFIFFASNPGFIFQNYDFFCSKQIKTRQKSPKRLFFHKKQVFLGKLKYLFCCFNSQCIKSIRKRSDFEFFGAFWAI